MSEDISRIKRFRIERFHSRLLIPWKIAEKSIKTGDIEHVLLWQDVHQQGYKFKEGEEVAHKESLSQKMFVHKILVSNIVLKSGMKFSKMIGIMCHWYEDCPCVDDIKYSSEEMTPELSESKT